MSEVLTDLAEQVGDYYRALIDQRLPEDVVYQLVYDWHRKQVGERDPIALRFNVKGDIPDYKIANIIKAVLKQRQQPVPSTPSVPIADQTVES